jgi:hypothetical protein
MPRGTARAGTECTERSAPVAPVRTLTGSSSAPGAGRRPGKEFQLCVSARDSGRLTMLFYITLALACLFGAVVCLWLYRSMVEVGKSAFRSLSLSNGNPGLESRRAAALDEFNAPSEQTLSPWGWSKYNAPDRSRTGSDSGVRKEIPWGWPGSSGLKRSNHELVGGGLENSAAADSMKPTARTASSNWAEAADPRPEAEVRQANPSPGAGSRARFTLPRTARAVRAVPLSGCRVS